MSEQPVHISEVLPTEFNPVKLRETLDRPFPPENIKTRKGNFGAELSYVEGHEYIRRLNEAFGVAWSFQIIEHEVLDDECIVLGKLTTHGHVRMAFGGSSVTRHKDSREPISIADDLKAAATDAFKKSCSFLGVGLHLYSSDQPPGGVGTGTEQPKGNGNGHSQPGNGNGNGNGNGTSPRLSSKQLGYILSLGKDQGLDRTKLQEMAYERYSRNLEFLTKSEASFFIGELQEM